MLYSDGNRIKGIYNFCDRWCERCEFTSRCEVFAREQAYNLEESLDPMGDALKVVADSFAEAKEMLIDHAEEMGIDLEEAMNDPEVDATIERTRRNTESNPAVELAKQYALETRRIVDRAEDWAGDPEGDPKVLEALEVIQYYLSPSPSRSTAATAPSSILMATRILKNWKTRRATATAPPRSRSSFSNARSHRGITCETKTTTSCSTPSSNASKPLNNCSKKSSRTHENSYARDSMRSRP